jgi:competence protein ComEC
VGALALAGADVTRVRIGDAGVLGHWRWRILWPDDGAAPGNDASVTVALDALHPSARSALLLGDLGEHAQVEMAGVGRPGAVDVVKVGHHGSADQSPALYDRLDAVVGLIGVGADNGYGHPTGRLLGMLSAAGTLALRTDQHGLVLVSAAPDGGVSVWTERVGPGG